MYFRNLNKGKNQFKKGQYLELTWQEMRIVTYLLILTIPWIHTCKKIFQ
jgi:uncharacterized membrane protein YccF (DUF307 family)